MWLLSNQVPKNLIKRLCRSAKHAISGDLQADSVDLLHVVSDPLKMEMHYLHPDKSGQPALYIGPS